MRTIERKIAWFRGELLIDDRGAVLGVTVQIAVQSRPRKPAPRTGEAVMSAAILQYYSRVPELRHRTRSNPHTWAGACRS
jgi:hypothetical protein